VAVANEGESGWEQLFRLVFEQSSHPIVLLDEDRRIVAANTAAAELWGSSRADLAGRSIVDSIDPGERAQAAREWQAFLRSGEYSGSRQLLRADGTRVRVSFAARRAPVDGRALSVYVLTPARAGTPEGAGRGTPLPLTERERQVITLIALGRETDEIAAELHISRETVRSHVRNAMSKLGVHTRAQLVAVTLCAERALHETAWRASEIPRTRD
jgi:PAS domain S-box-containing protein